MNARSRIHRVRVKNYKSIEWCDVPLDRLQFLVGPNGAGKSNFLDALRFISDALENTLENALRERGGIGEVRKRSAGRPTNFSLHVDFTLPTDSTGTYGFVIAAKAGGYEVQEEMCRVQNADGNESSQFHVQRGVVVDSSELSTLPSSPDRLYLPRASDLPVFRPVYDYLCGMSFYNLRPEVIRDLQTPDQGVKLRRDGSNLASVISSIARNNTEARQRIHSFLSQVLEGCISVESQDMLNKTGIFFTQRHGPGAQTWQFPAQNMSDGTLRALGVLTALFQGLGERNPKTTLVGIEEPELAVHPFAAAVLRDALQAASESVQVIVTSHSPDILDDKSIAPEAILSVVMGDSGTRIAPLNAATSSLLNDRLFTAGELLRQDQLLPAMTAAAPNDPDEPGLFTDGES